MEGLTPSEELRSLPLDSAPTRRRGRGRGLLGPIVLLILLCGLAAGGYHLYQKGYFIVLGPTGPETKGTGGGKSVEWKQFNCRYSLPPDPWKPDDALLEKMHARLALARSGSPSAWMALFAQDYKKKTPRDAVMMDEGVRRLQGFFKEFEYEKKDDGELAGQRAQQFTFLGQDANEALVRGECLMLAHQGLAYWLVTWAPAETIEKAQAEFPDLRQRFALISPRDNWTENRPRPLSFTGTKTAYTLQDTEGLWAKRTAEDYDPAADLALYGTDRDAPKEANKNAQVLVLVLKPKPGVEPAVQVRDYVVARYKAKSGKVTNEGKPQERPTRIGKAEVTLTTMELTSEKAGKRFLYLAVVAGSEQVLAFYGDCAWDQRALWEADFNQLLATLQLGK